MQLYYQQLRRRAQTLEANYLPEPQILPTLVLRDEDGLPLWVCIPTKFDWTRKEGQPVPPKILELVEPELRAAYEASLAAEDRAGEDGAAAEGAANGGDEGEPGNIAVVGPGRKQPA